jgi:hypothetical protein
MKMPELGSPAEGEEQNRVQRNQQPVLRGEGNLHNVQTETVKEKT